ncbi:MAG: hypothetical protein JNL08_00975 [Planctomycetes bacterium]|nr:hypothetical protein [Planctomycetota bacterium]
MTRRFTLVMLIASACSSNPASRPPFVPGSIGWGGPSLFMVDTDGDGLPDAAVPRGGTFMDTDDDGLPDTRLDSYWTSVGTDRCNAIGMTAVRAAFARLELAADEQAAAGALDDLVRTIVDVQRIIAPPP